MYLEIEQVKAPKSLSVEKKIEHTMFSVVKPENEIGTVAVFVTENNQMIVKNYNDVTNKEIKKERYNRICFVVQEKFPMEFVLKLNSDLSELLMQTHLKCQVKIKDYKAIAANPNREIGEELIQEINIIVRQFIELCTVTGTELISKLCEKLPELVKEAECEAISVESCRMVDIRITDQGKKDKVKQNVRTALKENDLFELYENKELVKDLLEIRREITRANEEDKIQSLTNENEYYDLILQKYTKFKDSGLLPADVTINAFMNTLKEHDSIFSETLLQEKEQESQDTGKDKEKAGKTEEKAYFE